MGYNPPKNIYDATIGDKKLQVDIYDLPYDEFSAENPLVIFGNVVLSDKIRTTNLDNVRIVGSLDISKQKQMIIFPKVIEGAFICRSNTQMRSIDNPKTKVDIFGTDFVFPQGITEIDCSHSIPNLSYLMDRIPFATRKIVVADALFNNLHGADLINAHLLLQKYPDLVIVGEKKGKTLNEVLESIPMESEKPAEEPVIVKSKQKPAEPETIQLKTADWFDSVDILEIVRQDKRRKSVKILDSTLERKIRDLIKKFDYQTLKKEHGGTSVLCIHKDNLYSLIEMLMENLGVKAPKTEDVVPVIAEPIIEKPVTKTEIPEEKIEIQTEDFCNFVDIINICKADTTIQSFNISDSGLEKAVRKYMKTFERKKLLNEQTGIRAYCIEKANAYLVLQKVVEFLQKEARKKEAKIKAQPKKTVATPKTNHTKTALKTTKHARALPIAIKKYIPKNLWKEIIRLCNRNDATCISVLENVAAINTDICETIDSTHVHIINPKTHERTTSSYIKREDKLSLVQGLSSSLQDDKRIVWSYIPEDRLIVCVGVLKGHTNTKNKNSYSLMRDNAAKGLDAKGKKITLQKVLEEEYLDVDFLLKQYKEQEKQVEEVSATRAGIVPILADEQPIKPIVVKPVKKDYVKPETKIEQKAEQQKSIFQFDTPQDLCEVRVAEAQVNAIIKTLNNAIKQNLEDVVTEEDDVAKQLAQLDAVRDAIVQKAKLQAMISEIGKTDEILQKLRTHLNGHSK